MNTSFFNQHRRTPFVLRWIQLTIVWALLMSLLPLNSTPSHGAGRILNVAVPAFTAINLSAWQPHSAVHDSGYTLQTQPPLAEAAACVEICNSGWAPPG